MRSDDVDDRSPARPSPTTIRSTDDVELATYDFGGSGPEVLMVHATGFCAGVWLPIAGRLPDFSLAALDVRGHGRSTTATAGMDWHGTADDVLTTVDELGLGRPFGVGHSMGGASLILAELARPGTFRGLWVYEPIIFPASAVPSAEDGRTPENPLSAGARRRRERFASREEAYANFASKPPLDALAPEALAAYVEHGFRELPDGSVELRCAPATEAETYEMGMRHGAFDRLAEVQCPVVVLRGRVDVPGPASIAELVAERLPAGTLEEHPELGHFGPLEDPAGMATSIRSSVTAGS